MKEVMAVIRMNMMNQTKRALADAGISSFTATGRVVGRGKVDYRLLEGVREGYDEAIAQLGREPRLIPKRLITIVVPDNLVKTAVKTIIETNRTGRPGDGKVFVMPVMESYRIRTGESGDRVLDE